MSDQMYSNRNCDEGHYGPGFMFPLLVIPIGIGLMMGLARAKRRHFRAHFRGNWENGVPPMFAEWHRRAHESQAASQSQPSNPGQPV